MNTDILKEWWYKITDRVAANDDEEKNPYVSGFKRDFLGMFCIYLMGAIWYSVFKMEFLVFDAFAIWNFPEWVRGLMFFTNVIFPMISSGYRVRKELHGGSEVSTHEEE